MTKDQCQSAEPFSRRSLFALAALGAPTITVLMSHPARSTIAATQLSGAATPGWAPAAWGEEIQRRNADISAAWLNGDVERRMVHYTADSISNPDYQPRLFGLDAIARYYRVLASRQRVGAHAFRTTEILPLGEENVLELGRFELAYTLLADGASHRHQGRYAHLWRREPDGSLKLKAEVWGYFERIENPASHSLGEREAAGRAAPPGDPVVEAELGRLNVLDAEAVKTHDAAAKIARYADDAIYMPYADTPKVGIDEIRAHLVRYTEQGRGVTFESVRVWNEGFEALDRYVVEYPKFEVRWRNGQDSGIVSGGGLRLWRRQADGSLKMFRQIATHDHRA
jgi:ketosteroid isomerase-like protein